MEIMINRMWPNRKNGKERYTVGRISIDGRYQCNTLELPTKDEDGNDKTGQKGYAIPYGVYDIRTRYSPKFKRQVLWVVINGNSEFNNRFILFHAGNRVQDTQGCVLIGENTKVGWLSNSRIWEDRIFEQVYPVLKSGKKVTLKVI